MDAQIRSDEQTLTYAATHRAGRKVAIKVLRPEKYADPVAKARLHREAYWTNRIGHPGVIPVVDNDRDGERAFIVFDPCEGESLETVAARGEGPMDAAELLLVVDDVLDVLIAAHERSVVHDDITAANILMTPSGAVRLLSFGKAPVRKPEPVGTKTLLGPGPLSLPSTESRSEPSQSVTGAQRDLWALGALMFTLLTRKPLQTIDLEQPRITTTSGTIPMASAALAGLPEAVRCVIENALSPTAERRFPDARSMQRAVRNARQSLNSLTTTSTHGNSIAPAVLPFPTSEPRASNASDRGTQIWLSVAAVAMIGVGAFAVRHQIHARSQATPIVWSEDAPPTPLSASAPLSPATKPEPKVAVVEAREREPLVQAPLQPVEDPTATPPTPRRHSKPASRPARKPAATPAKSWTNQSYSSNDDVFRRR